MERWIVAALANGEFELTLHARKRMRQRNVEREDIAECGRTASSCVYDPGRESYRVEGVDLSGNELTLIVGVEDGIVIVTLF